MFVVREPVEGAGSISFPVAVVPRWVLTVQYKDVCVSLVCWSETPCFDLKEHLIVVFFLM